eukprot:5073253-Prymnesium_polylepis.1
MRVASSPPRPWRRRRSRPPPCESAARRALAAPRARALPSGRAGKSPRTAGGCQHETPREATRAACIAAVRFGPTARAWQGRLARPPPWLLAPSASRALAALWRWARPPRTRPRSGRPARCRPSPAKARADGGCARL